MTSPRPERTASGSAGDSDLRDLRGVPTDLGFAAALWRAVDVFRAVAVLYAAAAYATGPVQSPRPWLGWVVLALMAVWTAFVWRWPRRPGWLLVADLALACLAVLATLAVVPPGQTAATNTLPLIWPAAAVLSWALWRGWLTGVMAALAVGAADLVVIDPLSRATLHNVVLLLLAGAVVGFAAEQYEGTRRELAAALESAAAVRERERLARDIHDSVLQVLAYVQRRGNELGGEARDLGRMAGEQEARLRGLVSSGTVPEAGAAAGGGVEVDVMALLRPHVGAGVNLSGPAEPVGLPRDAALDLVAATLACLHNVKHHAGAGAQAWLLVEDEGGDVVVSVRDDGVGIAPGRLEQARQQGRMGVSLSVRGRVTDHGGSVRVHSAPGQGTEVEMRVPRPAP